MGILLCMGMTSPLLAQDTGQIPGGDTGGFDQPVQQVPTTQDPFQGTFQDTEFDAQNEPPDFSELFDFDIAPEVQEFENLRIQPFVGRSLDRYIEQGLVHPRSLFSADSVGNNQAFGGGGGTGNNRFGGQNQTGGLQPGAQNGFEVPRQSLRTRARPQFFVANKPTPRQVSTRFQQRLAQMQIANGPDSELRVNLAGSVAILSGTVASAEERDRVVRMARLEPGIYRIENRIDVRQ